LSTLTLLNTYYNENSYLQQYGNLFAAKFPNIEVKVVSTQAIYQPGINNSQEQFDKLIKEEKPDILLLNMNQYAQMVADGKLLELDSLIKKDKFDIENIFPAVMDLIKSKGYGKLYGLTPSFNSSALFYNKDMFDQYGVPYPNDQMSWDEVMQLAKRFPTNGDKDKRIYGYYMNAFLNNSIFQLAYTIAHTEGKSYIDDEGSKITINDDD
jgi:multiple sugar transport system substrate-binding protein